MKNLWILTLACVVGLIARPSSAQLFADVASGGVVPQLTACAYTFTSGADRTLFKWCVTANGNVTKIETPAGQNQQPGSAEGYAVCSHAGVHGHDQADVIQKPFGPPVVLAGCISGTSCTIQRDTTDGVFRLVQKFSENPKEREINIEHTLRNISAALASGVELVRLTAFSPENDWGDDRGDRSLNSAWLSDAFGLISTAHTFTGFVQTFIVNGWSQGCQPVGVPSPTPPGMYAAQLNYSLGNLAPGQKKVVRVQLRQH